MSRHHFYATNNILRLIGFILISVHFPALLDIFHIEQGWLNTVCGWLNIKKYFIIHWFQKMKNKIIKVQMEKLSY